MSGIIDLRDINDAIFEDAIIDKQVSDELDTLLIEAIFEEEFDGDTEAFKAFLNEATQFMQRDGILHEGSAFILDAEAKANKARSIAALRIAKSENDASYKRLVKVTLLRNNLRTKIREKYRARADAEVRKKMGEIRKSSRVSNLMDKFKKNVV